MSFKLVGMQDWNNQGVPGPWQRKLLHVQYKHFDELSRSL